MTMKWNQSRKWLKITNTQNSSLNLRMFSYYQFYVGSVSLAHSIYNQKVAFWFLNVAEFLTIWLITWIYVIFFFFFCFWYMVVVVAIFCRYVYVIPWNCAHFGAFFYVINEMFLMIISVIWKSAVQMPLIVYCVCLISQLRIDSL